MEQYDIILTQNQASSGVEFSEKVVNLGNQSLLIGGASGALNEFPVGTQNQVLAINASGNLAWVDQDVDPTGTSSSTFTLDNDEASAAQLVLKASADVDSDFGLEVEDGLGQKANIGAASIILTGSVNAGSGAFSGTVTSGVDPSGDDDLCRKSWVESQINNSFAQQDAMVFKGVVISDADFQSKAGTSYSSGWTFKVSVAGTYAGKACEIGDMLVAVSDAGGAYNAAHWSVIQTNIDGAVTNSDTIVVDGDIPVFNGTTGKVIATSGYAPSDFTPISHVGSGGAEHAVVVAAGAAGFMSGADKTKLDGIESGANNYVFGPLTGDVTTPSAGSYATTIAARAVSLSKMADLNGKSIIANTGVSAATPQAVTFANLAGAMNSAAAAPAVDDAGVEGQIIIYEDYLYACVVGGSAGNALWKRTPLANYTA